jgi:hypothetical protein
VNNLTPVFFIPQLLAPNKLKMLQCFGSVTFWYGTDPDPARIRILLFSSVAFKILTKSFFAYYFLKIKIRKEVAKQFREIKGFLTFFA